MTSLTLTKSFVNDNVHWFYVFIKILNLKKKINCDIRSYVVFTLESSAFIKRHVCNLSFYVPDWYVFIYRRAFFRSFTRNQCIFHGVICMVMLKCVTWIRTILVVFFYFVCNNMNKRSLCFILIPYSRKVHDPVLDNWNLYSSGRFSPWYAYYQQYEAVHAPVKD